ncbi:MAG: hypothetical protein DSY78_00415 [Chloroflexi bacterium]|nr:MAG: hypothetical protein DSY78_00415 [Chloroflexota bacterium]
MPVPEILLLYRCSPHRIHSRTCYSIAALKGFVERADLDGADLFEANLSRADLSETNLDGANLSDANMPNANLTGANLSHVDLSGANLDGVIGADFSRAKNVPPKYLKD